MLSVSLYSLATFSYLADSYEQYGSSAIGNFENTPPFPLLMKLSISGTVIPPQHFCVSTTSYFLFVPTSPFDLLPLASGIFPLFTDAMYRNLGYPQASSLLGGLAFAFSILPFLLMAYGPRIRKKSRVAKQIAWQQEKRAAEAVRNMKEDNEKDLKQEEA